MGAFVGAYKVRAWTIAPGQTELRLERVLRRCEEKADPQRSTLWVCKSHKGSKTPRNEDRPTIDASKDQPNLGPILETIGSLTRRIREYDRRLEAIANEHYPETELLRQVEGAGPLAALIFVLTLEDPYRFEKSRSVGAYSLGLVPARDQSGDRDPQRRIS